MDKYNLGKVILCGKIVIIMATMKELRDERLRKLEEIKKLGINPYPSKSNRTNDAGEIIDNFEEFEGAAKIVSSPAIVPIRMSLHSWSRNLATNIAEPGRVRITIKKLLWLIRVPKILVMLKRL